MELDLNDALETTADPVLLWQRMLEPSAVIGFLGGEAKDVRALTPTGSTPVDGHTFWIKGMGGGRYHARIDQRREHELVSYTVWREDVPDRSMLLTYMIDASGPRTMLAGAITMDMPLDELLASFSLPGVLALPLVGRLVRRYVARRLRTQLLTMSRTVPAGDLLP